MALGNSKKAVDEMLSYFPARDVEEPVTKDFLRAEMAELRTEMERMVRSFQAWTVGATATIAGLVVLVGTFVE